MSDGDLRSLFRKHIPEAWWVSIETPSTTSGVPDSWYQFKGGASGWIEHKRSYGNAVRFRKLQPAWLERCSRMGGRCFIAVRVNGDGDLVLFTGHDAFDLRDRGMMGVTPIARWAGTPAQWGWDEVRAILTR
jgi:hypothetical protein